MNAVLTDLNPTASARVISLDPAQLAHRVPAAFADRPAAKTSSKYIFLSTKTLLDGLFEAGFVAVAATQTHSRRGSDPAYARHMLRFQHPRESVTLVDAIPQIVLLNAHDGSTSYVRLVLACHHRELKWHEFGISEPNQYYGVHGDSCCPIGRPITRRHFPPRNRFGMQQRGIPATGAPSRRTATYAKRITTVGDTEHTRPTHSGSRTPKNRLREPDVDSIPSCAVHGSTAPHR